MSSSFKEDYPDDFEVTPWKVEGSVDYARLIKKFGTQEITDEILKKIESFTGELHPLLKHKFFFSHRDLDWILNKYENNEKFYLYTGRGPSGMVHLGHLMPWFLTKHLQDKFDSNLLFQ
ncbi:MAG TPA: tryptophan--tRNA ligase, partial [Nitrososphaeraceae archaeon]|nr:tryptophan--tRNA ligase [Nitrososphaeraceae archaeon]